MEVVESGVAENMRFGIILVREFEEYAEQHLSSVVDSLEGMGCVPQNIVVRTVPKLHDVVVATQFFAEYTDVDGVIIIAPENRVMGTLSIMNGIMQIQVQWNMIVEIGGDECAENIVEMVTLQNEMEFEAAENNIEHNSIS